MQVTGMSVTDRIKPRLVETRNGCLEMPGERRSHHRSLIRRNGKWLILYRVLWAEKYGEISPKQHLCHKCDNPPCCNIDHLFLGDAKTNMADAASKGRTTRGIKNTQAKLNDCQVLAIRADSRKAPSIGADYGISQWAVFDIKARRTWAWLKEIL